MEQITVQLPDGSQRECPVGVTCLEVAHSIGAGLARQTVAAKVDGVLSDVGTSLITDCSIELVTLSTPEGLEVYRHTAAHIMAQAVKEIYGGAVQVTIGPAVQNGFYYDFYSEDHASN